MEVYILDALLRRIEVVDDFESMIWTERYAEFGDFEIDIKSTLRARGQFQPGVRLALNNSYRMMTVETVTDTLSADGKDMLKIKGPSAEAVLQDRVARNAMTDTTTEPNWTIVDTPGNVARTMFDHVARSASLDANDNIPFLVPGSIFSVGTNPESTTSITWVQSIDSLYNAVKAVCDGYDLGFRLYRNFDTSELYFDVYTGDDRTTRQTLKTPVIFGPDFDNIENLTELTQIQGSKNVAYVFSPAGFKVVFGENVDPDIYGFDRRVLVVDASNVQAGDPDADTLMEEAGTQALSSNRALHMFDGEINQQNQQYVYGVDYNLGDIVEVRNKDGIITYKRVTENIFVSDQNGDRSYPTLSADVFAGVDTWISWNPSPTVWFDYDGDTDTTWSSL